MISQNEERSFVISGVVIGSSMNVKLLDGIFGERNISDSSRFLSHAFDQVILKTLINDVNWSILMLIVHDHFLFFIHSRELKVLIEAQ